MCPISVGRCAKCSGLGNWDKRLGLQNVVAPGDVQTNKQKPRAIKAKRV